MSQGTIVQCIGAVVDVQFPRDAMPPDIPLFKGALPAGASPWGVGVDGRIRLFGDAKKTR